MQNIWTKLNKPTYALAPMEDATDTVFRQIVAELGKPDLFFTEFTNVEGLISEKGFKNVSRRLKFTKNEKPIIAQIWGINPSDFTKTAQLIKKMGFDGIDLNMGCPERKVIKTGACSALIKNKKLAGDIINNTKKGSGGLPISVKTRLGFDEIDMSWITFLLEQDIAALTVHLRTVKEMSDVPAHWDEMEKIVNLKNNISPHTLIIGNGDIKDLNESKNMTDRYKIDGVMIGRGIFTNPWLFNKKIEITAISKQNRINVLKKHITLFDKTYKEQKNYNTLKKYYKIYISNFEGASELRVELMNTKSCDEALSIISNLES